jgi:hypothetical protein
MADVRPGRCPRTDSGILHAACSDPLRIPAASLQMPGASPAVFADLRALAADVAAAVPGWLGQQAGSGQVRRLAQGQEAGGTQHAGIHRPLQVPASPPPAAGLDLPAAGGQGHLPRSRLRGRQG